MKARRLPGRYVAVAALAVAAAAVGLVGPAFGLQITGKPSAAEKIKKDPPPPLYDDAAIAPMARQLAAQQQLADRLIIGWQARHGSTRDDVAFTAWVQSRIPPPPGTAERTAELHQLQALDRARTAAGVSAATWLEAHGKKDIWQVYQHDQTELESSATGKADTARLKSAMKLSSAISKQMKNHYQSSSPYVLDHSLRPEKKVTRGQKCPCSYPSHHAALASTAEILLSATMPARADEYRWMAAEVTYSREYNAGHFPSDIMAGALLGDLVADYTLLTTNSPLPTATATATSASPTAPASPSPPPSNPTSSPSTHP